ncbi:SDR family NAD(P)-dependent oxidoreductase [Solirubrobacter taibaiensis]|nr:SDR family NAD(P)-dependent oxidoreductase [Solirubrobacter taibaiensis]
MAQTLQGTVALVTGASSGIGEATARALAERGAKVAVAARRKDRLDTLAGEIDGLAVEADVTQRDQATAAVETTVSELGRLDIVINNAGVMLLGTIADAPVEEWDRMFDLNVKGLMYVAHAALPHLIEAAESDPRRVADLVNVSSVAGRRVGAGGGVYQATKHAVGVFSEALRQEVTERHVRVALMEPGAVATELTHHMRPEIRDALSSAALGNEILQSEDIADAIAYMVTRPRHMGINEMLIRPTEQVR